MKTNRKRYIKITIFTFFIFSIIPFWVIAAEGYTLLTPIPGLSSTNVTLGPYLERIFIIAISMAAILAVFFIVMGGIQYMSTDAWFEKKEGISKIQNAALGLLLVISSWLILNTINPDILSFNLNITKTEAPAPPDINPDFGIKKFTTAEEEDKAIAQGAKEADETTLLSLALRTVTQNTTLFPTARERIAAGVAARENFGQKCSDIGGGVRELTIDRGPVLICVRLELE